MVPRSLISESSSRIPFGRGRGLRFPRRLVRQQDRGPVDVGAGDGHTLLLAAGELMREPLALVLEPDHLEHLGHQAPHHLARGADHREGELDVLIGRLGRQQSEVLEDHADVAAQRRDAPRRDAGEIAAGDVHGAAGGGDLLEHHAHHGGLAGAGGSDEEHELPTGELDVEILHRGVLASHVRLGDVVETDHGCLFTSGKSCVPSVGAIPRDSLEEHLPPTWSKPGQGRVPMLTSTCRADGPAIAFSPGSCSAPRASGSPAFDELVDLAVEHGGGVALLVLGAQVLDHLVRVQHVRAHLVTPAGLDVTGELLALGGSSAFFSTGVGTA